MHELRVLSSNSWVVIAFSNCGAVTPSTAVPFCNSNDHGYSPHRFRHTCILLGCHHGLPVMVRAASLILISAAALVARGQGLVAGNRRLRVALFYEVDIKEREMTG